MSRITDYVIGLEENELIVHTGEEYKWLDKVERATWEARLAVEHLTDLLKDKERQIKKDRP